MLVEQRTMWELNYLVIKGQRRIQQELWVPERHGGSVMVLKWDETPVSV